MSKKLFLPHQVNEMTQFLQAGQLLAYPTEAVWGIGCDPFNMQAVEQILAIKNRAYDKGMIVITSDEYYIQEFLQPLPKTIQQMITNSWHQPKNQATTWLLPIPQHLTKQIPVWVTGGKQTLAVRVVRQLAISSVCEYIAKNCSNNPFGFLISTSCNPSTLMPAIDFFQAYQYFNDKIGYLIADTLHFTQPSQIKEASSGQLIRN